MISHPHPQQHTLCCTYPVVVGGKGSSHEANQKKKCVKLTMGAKLITKIRLLYFEWSMDEEEGDVSLYLTEDMIQHSCLFLPLLMVTGLPWISDLGGLVFALISSNWLVPVENKELAHMYISNVNL